MLYYKLGNDLFSANVKQQFGENHLIPSVGLTLVLPLRKGMVKEYIRNHRVVTIIVVPNSNFPT